MLNFVILSNIFHVT